MLPVGSLKFLSHPYLFVKIDGFFLWRSGRSAWIDLQRNTSSPDSFGFTWSGGGRVAWESSISDEGGDFAVQVARGNWKTKYGNESKVIVCEQERSMYFGFVFGTSWTFPFQL